MIVGSLGCPSNVKTPSSPSGPNNSPTPTPTLTPLPVYMIDDFEDGNTLVLPYQGRNGSWYDYATSSSTISPSPFVVSSPGYNSNYCASVSGTTDSTSGHNSVLTANFLSGSTPYSIPVSYSGIAFMIKGSVSGSSALWFEVADSTTNTPAAKYDEDGAWVTVSSNWSPVTVFFSQMNTQGFGIPQGTHPLDTSNAINFSWQVETRSVTFNFQVDNVQFTTAAVPPSGTQTPSTNTPSPTDTPFPTNTPVNTPTGTITPNTPTGTPTIGSTVTCPFPAAAGRQTTSGTLLQQGAGYIVTTQISIPSYVGIQTIWAYLGNAQGMVSAALYTDNGSGAPGTLLSQSTPQSAVDGWNTLPMPQTFVYAGNYWLALQMQGTTQVDYGSGLGNTNYVSAAWGSFPATYSSSGVQVTDTLTMYVMYCNSNTPTPSIPYDGSTTGGQMNNPQGVAYDYSNGLLYVADLGNFNVAALIASSMATSFSWSIPGGSSTDSCVATDGTNIYVGDQYSTVDVYDSMGVATGASYGPTQPVGIYASSGGTTLLLTYSSTQIAEYVGLHGTMIGPSVFFRGVAMGPNGNIYAVDPGDNKIYELTPTGSVVTSWGGTGSGNGQFNDPQYLSIDGSGNVYVTDSGNNRVEKFDSSGGYLYQWGSSGTGPWQFNGPEGIAVDTAGYIYVCDSGNNRIEKFGP